MRNWTTSPETLADVTRTWLTSARWFTGDPNANVAFAHACPLAADDHVSTVAFLVQSGDLTFSVPLTFEAAAPEGQQPKSDLGAPAAGLTSESTGLAPEGEQPDAGGQIGMLGSVAVWDATSHPAGQRALLGVLYAGRTDTVGALRLTSQPIRGELPDIVDARKLTSEQSNTSIIYRFAEPDTAGSAGIILKLFRVLSNGLNPDVELQQALDAANSQAVPRQYGSVRAAWGSRETELLVAQEFLEGATDAWQVITERLAGGDTAVTSEITALGSLTAQIHTELARAFGTVPPAREVRTELVAQWKARADRALGDAPQLADLRSDIHEVFDRAGEAEWPNLQRIHGDYHLGQVLHVPDRGWVALDFEGEPLRPLSQRTAPDLALRDVAGMLRSFDYAAGSVIRSGGNSEELTAWAGAAQHAFMGGYTAGYGDLRDSERTLLDALVLDKALYEVSYEVASRPDWVEIPVRGVLQLFALVKTQSGVE